MPPTGSDMFAGNRDCWMINGLCRSAKFVSERDLSVTDLSESIKIPLG